MFRSFHFRFASGIKGNVRSLKDALRRDKLKKASEWFCSRKDGLGALKWFRTNWNRDWLECCRWKIWTWWIISKPRMYHYYSKAINSVFFCRTDLYTNVYLESLSLPAFVWCNSFPQHLVVLLVPASPNTIVILQVKKNLFSTHY